MTCPFCDHASINAVWSSELSLAFRDRYPVSPGHTLIIPKRHVATFFEATPAEQSDLLQAINELKARLDDTLDPKPDGYNVGINAGEAAGQTVMHLHVHLIPRYRGDMRDPRGGVRGVIPWKQSYDPNGPQGEDRLRRHAYARSWRGGGVRRRHPARAPPGHSGSPACGLCSAFGAA